MTMLLLMMMLLILGKDWVYTKSGLREIAEEK